jgi:CheY-like chemotaxis protein
MNQPPLLRILVVDDHGDTRSVLSHMLTMRNYQVTQAATVEEALEIFQNCEFDLIISDLGLPDGTGYDLLARMREIKPVKAIALSGYGSGEDLAKSKAIGFEKHLTKPIDFEHLDFAVVEVAGARP